MEFKVLGPVEIRIAGQAADAGHPRQRAVLAVLLLDLGRVVPAELLIDRVWGEQPPASGRNVLYGYVARLRAVLARAADPEVTLARRQGGYLLQAGAEQVDLSRFRRLAAQATAAAGDDERAAALLRQALGLWRGPALAGLDSPWLRRMRETLELERAAAVLDLTDARLRLGQHGELVSELAGQAADMPADERLIGQLMLALYRSGRQAEALRWFEQTRQHLASELGADPAPQLQALHQQILRADPALALPEPAPTREALAGVPGVERSTVVRWERGETELVPWIRPRLARALRVTADRLVEELLAADGPPEDLPGPAAGRRDGQAATVPRQLPPAVAGFTGRAAELRALALILDDVRAGAPGTVVISAIGGTAGVGKTALALHWAHQVASRFDDGQLYVNLRGFDPSGIPVTPAEAIRGFLGALGVAPERIPPDPGAQAGLYRSLLADRRMLVVLDNARDEQQVRPLLPASRSGLVIVTSRNQLAGLAAAEGARLLTLDALTEAEARQLLAARLGSARAGGELEAVGEIAGLCARLPLALAVVAARAAARPRFPLAALAAELRDAASRLDALDNGDRAASVRAVFSWSYQQLSAESARMFRLLGLHPGPDISVPAAASLAGSTITRARQDLGELARACLITEHVPGRSAFHDLLRAYAAALALAHDSEPERIAATGRVLDHYLHTNYAAAMLLNSIEEPVTLAPSRPGVTPERVTSHQQAITWFEAERHVLLAAVSFAAESGFDIHAWQIPWTMMPFLHWRGHYQEWTATQHTALAAATRLGDTAGQALCCRLLGYSYSFVGDRDQALAHFAAGLKLYRQLGNRLGEAHVHRLLAVVAARQRDYHDALAQAEQALRLFQAVGDKAGEAGMLNNIGWYHVQLRDYQRARVFSQRSLTLTTELGNRYLEGLCSDSLGYVEHHLGNLAEAATCYQHSLSIFREIGHRFYEADVLTHLGGTRHAMGEMSQARDAWQQALAILDELQHPDADRVRAKLAGADDNALDLTARTTVTGGRPG